MKAATSTCAESEDKLSAANEEVQLAENRVATLKVDLKRLNSAATSRAGIVTAEGVVDVVVAAACATAAEREKSRAAVEDANRAAAIRVEAAERRVQAATGAALADRVSAKAWSQEIAIPAKTKLGLPRQNISEVQAEAQYSQSDFELARVAEVAAVRAAAEETSHEMALAAEDSSRDGIGQTQAEMERLPATPASSREENTGQAQTEAQRLQGEKVKQTQAADVAAVRASAEAASHEITLSVKAVQDSTRENIGNEQAEVRRLENIGNAQAEVQRLQGEVERVRAAEMVAVKEAKTAKSRSAALEEAVEESKRIQALFRERADSRLETLRLVVEEEEEEHKHEVQV